MESTVESLKARLIRRRKISDKGCWLWEGCLSSGYGTTYNGVKTVYVHRLAWEIFRGPIPPKMFMCHKCDNTRCFNPDHLFIGTPKDNLQDAIAKGFYIGGKTKHKAELIAKVKEMLSEGYAQRLIRDLTGVSQSTISEINRGVRKYAL